MASVLYAQSAKTDLLEAWLFIAEENLGAADGVADDGGITVLRILHHARDTQRVAF